MVGFQIPFSSLASDEGARFIEFERRKVAGGDRASAIPRLEDVVDEVRRADKASWRPFVERMRERYPVTIEPIEIGGVHAEVIRPPVSAPESRGILINLHGGGMFLGEPMSGRLESIPIAHLTGLPVITVHYRMAPEYRFPAASEDVEAVYRAILEDHPADKVALYGYSAGGALAAQALAWFQSRGLPRPVAAGIFGHGASGCGLLDGDSYYLAPATVLGLPVPEVPVRQADHDFLWVRLYAENQDPTDPLVSPVYSPSVLSLFPPTLFVTSGRDTLLSAAVYSHIQCVKAGAHAELFVWEGLPHNFLYDVEIPEAREAHEMIARFFTRNLVP